MDHLGYRILAEIVATPGLTVHELTDQTGEGMPAVQERCVDLVERGFIDRRSSGYFVEYHPTGIGQEHVPQSNRN